MNKLVERLVALAVEVGGHPLLTEAAVEITSLETQLSEYKAIMLGEIDKRGAVEAEVERLGKLVYVPGVTRCAKCSLRLISTNFHVANDGVSANNEPQACPNGCGPMWRVTEREAGNDLCDQQDELLARASTAEARLEEAAGLLRGVVGDAIGPLVFLSWMPTDDFQRRNPDAVSAAGIRAFLATIPGAETIDIHDAKTGDKPLPHNGLT